ncbi:proclotting enzyme [Drosophila innubila]|uniref:proclotting enzyme n=1 Tax=Drosophila innubila TaxID=198719 RepID=UPI00148D547C|nr:proclotting enzyme [Drosophila innubila]
MLLEDFCVRVYFWPFLSYLASIKGLCPVYPTGYYPVYTFPPLTATLTPTSSTSAAIPTFQPTPPLTTSTTTTSTTTSTTTTTTLPVTTCPPQPFVCLPGGVRPLPDCPCIDPRQQSQQPQQPQQQQQAQNLPIVASTLSIGSDMMIFVPLNAARRRRRRHAAQIQSCYDARSRSGSCLPLTSCAHLIEEYHAGSVTSEFQTFLGQSICGFDGSSFLVCCATERAPFGSRRPKEYVLPSTSPVGSFAFSPLGTATTQSPQSPQVAVFQPTPPFNQAPIVVRPTPGLPAPAPNPASVSSGCGIGGATTNRVVGGLPVRKGAYPWMAALGYNDASNGNALKFLCAGSLISSQFVVTSAHCINPMLILVRLGAHDLSKTTELGAIDFRIQRSFVHEQYDLASIANDIALIELNGVAPSNGDIRPICLPEGSRFQREDEFVGMNPFVAGYGATKHQGDTSNVLRDAQVPIVSRLSCEQNYKSVFQFVQFSDKLICAGSSTVDACQGDSGGPLMMPQLDGGIYRYHLLGIVSFGYECARPGFPGVYTRVNSYLNWIQQILQGSNRGRRR